MSRMQLRALYSLLGALPLALSACGDNVAVTSASGTGTTDSDTDDTSTSTSEGVTDTTDDETTAGPTTTTTSTTVGTSTSDPTTDGTTSETTHGENQDPIAVDDDSYVTKSGKNLLVPAGTGLLQNDSDPDMDPITVVAVDAVSKGGATIIWEPDGSFSYDAPLSFWGNDSFNYTITDGNNGFASGTVTINVGPTSIGLGDIAKGIGGFAINGEFTDFFTGQWIDDAGDVDDDGRADIVIGAPLADTGQEENAGVAYVVLGQTTGTTVYLTQLEDAHKGFRVTGAKNLDSAGTCVAGVGDFNGDARADFAVGVPKADPSGTNSGRAYVVHGTDETTPLTFNQLNTGAGGLPLDGQDVFNFAGFRVGKAGDVNGDGLDDVVVGAFGTSVGEEDWAGRAYVVFGKKETQPYSFAKIYAGIGGFALDGATAGDFTGSAVAGAGDVNGDGLADLIIGAYGFDGNGDLAGRAYVVFGKQDAQLVDLKQVADGVGGFAINGEKAGDWAGIAVAGAGDVNGDGLDDVIIGAPQADPIGEAAGRSYVIFGKEDGAPVELTQVAANQGDADAGGFIINGSYVRDYSGSSVDGLGDVNGDGLDDIIIGAYGADPVGGMSGRAFVVFGKKDTDAVTLGSIAVGYGGFAINGEAAEDQAGFAVGGGGDVDGDGFYDILVCAPGSDVTGKDSGRCYVVFGGDFSNVVTAEGTEVPEQINGSMNAEVFMAGGGNDYIRGNGGADILHGGAGNDKVFVRDTEWIRLDGGGGEDTLVLDMAGMVLDLTKYPDRTIRGFEIIDVSETFDNTLIADFRSLRALTEETNDISIKGGDDSTVLLDLAGEGFTDLGEEDFYRVFSNGVFTIRVSAEIDPDIVF
ncbi:MAG: Ig-like domain-containing protein [Nannocystaceae bacterium]|nr:FG-GAP repeat protein [Myxococcales bacterium]